MESTKDLSLIKISPARIISGEGILGGRVFEDLILQIKERNSNRAVFIVEKKILTKFRREFAPLMKVAKDPSVIFFKGECSADEVERLYTEVKKKEPSGASMVFASGGGKILDASKLLSERLGKIPLITIPTSCATCAAFTPIAPTYYPDGRKRKTIEVSRPPDIMIIDYKILINQPPRLLVSGIADAVAKFYETKAFIDSLKKNHTTSSLNIKLSGDLSTVSDDTDLSVRTAEAVSREILKGAFEISHAALNALVSGKITDYFRRITYLTLVMPGIVSGIGGKKCRTVAAHALANGLTYLPPARVSLHGEKVGWGTLVQLVLEEKFAELEELRSFFVSIKAPVKLSLLLSRGSSLSYPSVRKAFEVACAPDESMRFMSKKITPLMAYKAAMRIEKMG